MSAHVTIAFALAAALAGGEDGSAQTGTSTAVETAEESPVEDAHKAEAVAAFKAAKDAFAAADYFEALANFKRAQELVPTPELHYNIGLCHERVDNWDRAIESFELYLQETPDAFDRADVESRIDAAKRRKAKEARALEPAVVVIKEPPPVEPSPRIVANERTTRDAEPKPHRPLVASGATLLALGAAGAIGGGVGLTLQMQANEGGQSQRLDTLRWSSIGAGSAVAVTGAVLMGVGLQRRAHTRARRAQLVPQVGPQGAALTLQGRF